MKAAKTGAPPICVYCRRHPVDPPWRPFCSERCKMQDLAKWADGAYNVPGEPEDVFESEKVEGTRQK